MEVAVELEKRCLELIRSRFSRQFRCALLFMLNSSSISVLMVRDQSSLASKKSVG